MPRARGRRSAARRRRAASEDGPISLGSRHRRAARHDRRHRAGDRAEDRRIPRPARRPRLGRPARPGERDRAGDDGVAARAAAALSAGCASGARPRRSSLGIAALVVARPAHTRRDPRAGRGRARQGDAGARGGAGARLRARPGRARSTTRTVEDFRRSGLSHLLAVSGQNVALLALLAMPVLAALGMPLRARLVWILGLIAVYVPLAGAGPSIQRAGVMGALGVLATLAGRRGLAALRAGRRRGRDPGDRPAASPPTSAGSSASPRLLGILAAGGAPARGDRGSARPRRLARAACRGRGDDDRRDARHGAADRLPLRGGLDHDAARQPAGAARGGAGDVAGDAGGGGRPGARLPGRAAQLGQRAAARLHRPGGGLVRPAELGLPARAARHRRLGRPPTCDRRRRRPSPCAWPTSPLAPEARQGTDRRATHMAAMAPRCVAPWSGPRVACALVVAG